MTPAVFLPSNSNFVRFECSQIEHVHPIFCAHLIIFLGGLNLDIIMSTQPLECLHCLFGCDCSHIEDVHLQHRSRAEFGLVSI